MSIRLRPLVPNDWPQVAAIYAEGLATGNATFETEVPSWERWDAGHLKTCRWVAVLEGDEAIVGWAALSPVSSRPVYAGIGEVSVYVAERAWGRGVGKTLLTKLVEDSEENGMWTLQAGIMAENVASIRLHERCGFRVLGTRERPGKLAGVWRDTVVMERRSAVVGNE